MPLLSIAEAARRAGVDARTIRRQIEKGVLSASRGENGRKGIDPAELCRVYPQALEADPTGQGPGGGAQGAGPVGAPGIVRAELEGAQARARLLEEQLQAAQQRETWLQDQLERAQGQADDYRKQADELRDQVRLLTGPREEPASEPPQRRPWWARFMGRGD